MNENQPKITAYGALLQLLQLVLTVTDSDSKAGTAIYWQQRVQHYKYFRWVFACLTVTQAF